MVDFTNIDGVVVSVEPSKVKFLGEGNNHSTTRIYSTDGDVTVVGTREEVHSAIYGDQTTPHVASGTVMGTDPKHDFDVEANEAEAEKLLGHSVAPVATPVIPEPEVVQPVVTPGIDNEEKTVEAAEEAPKADEEDADKGGDEPEAEGAETETDAPADDAATKPKAKAKK